MTSYPTFHLPSTALHPLLPGWSKIGRLLWAAPRLALLALECGGFPLFIHSFTCLIGYIFYAKHCLRGLGPIDEHSKDLCPHEDFYLVESVKPQQHDKYINVFVRKWYSSMERENLEQSKGGEGPGSCRNDGPWFHLVSLTCHVRRSQSMGPSLTTVLS